MKSRILRYDGQSGAFIDAFVPPERGGPRSPEGLVFGPDGNLYVSDFDIHSVLKFAGTTGEFLGALVPPGTGGCIAPARSASTRCSAPELTGARRIRAPVMNPGSRPGLQDTESGGAPPCLSRGGRGGTGEHSFHDHAGRPD